ncbi:kinase [Candidatus Chlamydia corallus]|uniref:kinase n=1 Tax=Candidatus Chlamydia corallus TaxID=2038470 RepID=UPI000C2FCC14|nr:kinase [Candidatus Chlamydia corallus]
MGKGNWKRCPFFFSSGVALGKGRGEQVVSLKKRNHKHKYVLYLDDQGVSTERAYQSLLPQDLSRGNPKAFFYGENDLEKSVFRIRTDLKDKKHMLERIWSPFHSHVLMSGSGATLFVCYPNKFEKDSQAMSHIHSLIKQTQGVPVSCLYRKNQWYSVKQPIYRKSPRVCVQPQI